MYKLFNEESQFKQLALDSMSLFEQLKVGDEYFTECICFGESNTPFSPIWGNVASEFDALPAFPKSSELPHLSIWNSAALVMSDFAHAALKDALASEGEFLPMSVNGFTYYIFHLLSSVPVDESTSTYEMSHGAAIGITKLQFAESAKEKDLFKSFNHGLGGVFCSEHFKSTCEALDLNGLIFEENIAKLCL